MLRPRTHQLQLESRQATGHGGIFWEILVGCLLTTQQKSGPGKPVTRFINTCPYPLPYQTCCERDDLAEFALGVFKKFGGLRRTTGIGKELAANIGYLKDGGWSEPLKGWRTYDSSPPQMLSEMPPISWRIIQRAGPEQSRNLLQWTGLSCYEIPIDSRITRWLNDFGFPFKVSMKALSDRNYFNLVSEGFRNSVKPAESNRASLMRRSSPVTTEAAGLTRT